MHWENVTEMIIAKRVKKEKYFASRNINVLLPKEKIRYLPTGFKSILTISDLYC